MNSLLLDAVKLARKAGEVILPIYRGQLQLTQTNKADTSPVTNADLAAHALIVSELQKLHPGLPTLSEESVDVPFGERQQWQRYWLIDPLDGTKEFLDKNDNFTVNIALIENHQPVLGVVYAPALALCYFAQKGQGAFKQVGNALPQKIHTRTYDKNDLVIVASRHHAVNELQNFLEKLSVHTILHKGSALKFGLVAEGIADIYPRLGPTSEWDTAAAQCVVEEAGGIVVDVAGNPLRYNTKESLENPSFFAVGDKSCHWEKLFSNSAE